MVAWDFWGDARYNCLLTQAFIFMQLIRYRSVHGEALLEAYHEGADGNGRRYCLRGAVLVFKVFISLPCQDLLRFKKYCGCEFVGVFEQCHWQRDTPHHGGVHHYSMEQLCHLTLWVGIYDECVRLYTPTVFQGTTARSPWPLFSLRFEVVKRECSDQEVKSLDHHFFLLRVFFSTLRCHPSAKEWRCARIARQMGWSN